MQEVNPERPLEEPSELTDEELDAFGEFTEALVKGERPDIETYLACRPEMAERLRPSLEAAIWLKGQFDGIRTRPAALRRPSLPSDDAS
jgi:hypothetical protein